MRVIYLHKIIPVFLMPTAISLLFVALGLILRRRALCWAGVLLLWLASAGLVSKAMMRAAEDWETRKAVSTMPAAQAIVVLSAGRTRPPGAPGVSEWGDADRFYGGIELYKAKKAPLLIFTGGWVPWEPDARLEGEVLMQYAADLGVPADRMMTTGKVVNTNEEGRAVAALLKQKTGNATPRILLVTSAFHMRRARELFARAGLEAIPFPVDFKVAASDSLSIADLVPRAGDLARTELALREFYGMIFYIIFNN
jgi:uncharacterized SAM-binding protein YcdF (DUF218 family)